MCAAFVLEAELCLLKLLTPGLTRMSPQRLGLGLLALCCMNALCLLGVQGQAPTTCKKGPCYFYNEQRRAACVNDCQCDGARTCSASGDACKEQGSAFARDASKSACDTTLKYCNGGTAPKKAAKGSGIGTVSLDQCKNIAYGKCQQDALDRSLSPCGASLRSGFNLCSRDDFVSFYTGEINDLCQNAVVNWGGAGQGFCTGVAGTCDTPVTPANPCKGVVVTLQGSREFDLRHISGQVTIRNNNPSTLQLKGPAELTIFSTNGASPLKVQANCRSSSVRPNDQVTCSWRVQEPFFNVIFLWTTAKATASPVAGGTCSSGTAGLQGAVSTLSGIGQSLGGLTQSLGGFGRH